MSALQDSIKSFFLWPLVTISLYIRFVVGLLIVLVPILLHATFSTMHHDDYNIFNDFAALYRLLHRLPLGKYVFSGLTGFFAPNNAFYASVVTKLIGSGIKLDPNTGENVPVHSECEAYQPDFPWYRNPFGSMHAVALISLGEFVSGTAILSALQRMPHLRGIPVKIEATYLNKVRGRAIARAVTPLDSIKQNGAKTFVTTIHDEKGVLCAEVFVTWEFKVREDSKKR